MKTLTSMPVILLGTFSLIMSVARCGVKGAPLPPLPVTAQQSDSQRDSLVPNTLPSPTPSPSPSAKKKSTKKGKAR